MSGMYIQKRKQELGFSKLGFRLQAMCVILKFNQISQRYVVKLNSIKTFLLINKNLQLFAVFHWTASSYVVFTRLLT